MKKISLNGAWSLEIPGGNFETGKDHTICRECLLHFGEIHAPRYGCGLCQTGVPCEKCIPGKK